jgi:carbonic anhydrase/acetyltransferase-like protein (isoleucine patch superfamily)
VTAFDPRTIPETADASRLALGFLSVAATSELARAGVRVLDPFSTLVSPGIAIEPDAVLYPNVILEQTQAGRIRIGRGTRLWPGTQMTACGGSILIGQDAEIGEDGGFSFKVGPGESVTIGDRARLTGGGRLSETCSIGAGAQILGRIDVRSCSLEGGGSHREPDPDQRGAVLKGSGQARNIALGQGRVIQSFGLFSPADTRWQSSFHPRSPSGGDHPTLDSEK